MFIYCTLVHKVLYWYLIRATCLKEKPSEQETEMTHT